MKCYQISMVRPNDRLPHFLASEPSDVRRDEDKPQMAQKTHCKAQRAVPRSILGGGGRGGKKRFVSTRTDFPGAALCDGKSADFESDFIQRGAELVEHLPAGG